MQNAINNVVAFVLTVVYSIKEKGSDKREEKVRCTVALPGCTFPTLEDGKSDRNADLLLGSLEESLARRIGTYARAENKEGVALHPKYVEELNGKAFDSPAAFFTALGITGEARGDKKAEEIADAAVNGIPAEVWASMTEAQQNAVKAAASTAAKSARKRTTKADKKAD